MDVGLLILRLLLGAVLFAHGTQKAFGWFSGPGRDGAAAVFAKLGHQPASLMVLVAVTCEISSAVLIVSGFAIPLAAAIASGTLIVAGVSMCRLSKTLWAAAGGGEYALVLSATCLVLAFTGAGELSVDEAASTPWHELSESGHVWTGLLGALLAVVASAVPLVRASKAGR